MVGELVDVIMRDLREVVELEIKKFLEHYDDCEVVDDFRFGWYSVDEKHDMIIHGLPCYVIVYSADLGKVYETECTIEYWLDNRLIDKLLGWVRIVRVGGGCYAMADVMDKNIEDVARKIVEEVGVYGVGYEA
jgi:hypothetical protein